MSQTETYFVRYPNEDSKGLHESRGFLSPHVLELSARYIVTTLCHMNHSVSLKLGSRETELSN